MSARKREPREIKIAEIETRFELASYWFGNRWCPAVAQHERGFRIRFVKARVERWSGTSTVWDYFELDVDGVITTAPRGHAKDWKSGRVVDIAEAVARFAEPRPAERVL